MTSFSAPLLRLVVFASLAVSLQAFIVVPTHGQKPDEAVNSLPSLREAVGGRFKIGVGISDQIPAQPEKWPLLTRHFEIVTPENCMKPQGIQPAEGMFAFETPDRFVEFANSRDLEIVGHCLVWAKDDRTSDWWMTEDGEPTSPEKLLERMKTHIDTVVGRYADSVTMWDVVNEAIADSDGEYLRDSIWTRTTGEEFIAKAFEYTRAADPDALLIYNDYDCEKPEKRAKLVRLLKSLKARGTPVDAFGLQGHFELHNMQYDEIEATLQVARELGVKVVVSELDIDVMNRSRWWADGNKYREELATFDPYKDGLPAEVAQKQAEAYARLFAIFERNRDVIARVSFWNLHDGESWLNYFPWNRTNHPLLFDRQGEPKPAYAAVIKALQE